MKAEKLTWNVFTNSFNDNKIEVYNVFDHWRFCEDIDKSVKKYKKAMKQEGLTKRLKKALLDNFKETIENDLMYYFWSKYEWEIGITEPFEDHIIKQDCKYPWEKVDVYDQIKMNFDIFFDYIYQNLVEKKKKDET